MAAYSPIGKAVPIYQTQNPHGINKTLYLMIYQVSLHSSVCHMYHEFQGFGYLHENKQSYL